jgi:hypothetical protein
LVPSEKQEPPPLYVIIVPEGHPIFCADTVKSDELAALKNVTDGYAGLPEEFTVESPEFCETLFNLLLAELALSKLIVANLAHPSNALFPIVVTLGGISIEAKLEQFKNVWTAIFVKLEDN